MISRAIPTATEAEDRLGAWMGAALDDPKVCDQMKADIAAWVAELEGRARPTPQAGVVGELIERLRAPLPICPFVQGAPEHQLEPEDACPVCHDFGDERSKNLCRGADTRVMLEAADMLDTLQTQWDADEAAWRVNAAFNKQGHPFPLKQEEAEELARAAGGPGWDAAIERAAQIADKHAEDAEAGRAAAVIQMRDDLQIGYEEARLWSANIAAAIRNLSPEGEG